VGTNPVSGFKIMTRELVFLHNLHADRSDIAACIWHEVGNLMEGDLRVEMPYKELHDTLGQICEEVT
jgi:hypothetical protein